MYYTLHLLPADIGYAYGSMLAKEIDYAYHTLLESLLGDKFYDKLALVQLFVARCVFGCSLYFSF